MKRWIDTTKLLSCLIVLSLLSGWPAAAAGPHPEEEAALLPYDYARAWQKPAPVYTALGDPAKMTPVTTLAPPDTWVSIDEVIEQDGRQWYRIADQAYVLADDVLLGTPSLFHGLIVTQTLPGSPAFVVTPGLNVRARPGVALDNPPLSTLTRYDAVTVLASQPAGDAVWHQIDQDRYVHGGHVRVVYPVPRPEGVAEGAHWIAVDLAQQTLSAYEGDRMVFATLVSTGRPPYFTPKGLNRIWIKLQTGNMRGGQADQKEPYDLQDVPWIMYFNRDVGLHAAYWHDRFGYPSSRGCVNLSPQDAKWLFDWATPQLPFPDTSHVYASSANPGTWVYVYASSG
jgi:hypothetical protein